MIRTAIQIISGVSHVGVWACGTLLLLTSLIIGADVIARKLLDVTLPISHEIAGYALAISSAWAFSYTLLKRGHIRIDAVYNLLPQRLRSALDLVALAALGTFIGFVTWYALAVVTTSIRLGARANTPLGTPMWIPQSLWLAGLCVFMLAVVVLATAALRALVSGDHVAAERLIGIHGTAEEVEEEMEEAARLRRAVEGRSDS